MSKPSYSSHKADASKLLDDRGYGGRLIRGQNPAILFESGVRNRIIQSYYWKEQCFGLNEATLCDRAAQLKYIGGTTGVNGKPTPFLCLAFKLCQLVPEEGVVREMLNFEVDEDEDDENDNGEHGKREAEAEGNGGIENDETEEGAPPTALANIPLPLDPEATGRRGAFKYLRCLAAFYIRLAWEPVAIHQTLEPLLSDYRKIKRKTKEGYAMTYIDQFVDDLLTKERVCATSLWRMPPRSQLEDLDLLEQRVSPLQGEVDMLDGSDGEGVEEVGGRSRSKTRSLGSERSGRGRGYREGSESSGRSYSRSRSRSPRSERSYRRGGRDRSRSRTRSRSRSYRSGESD
ncbi:PRP38 family-domain-containing protein [Clohesyomyces aquaticus]|uniref:Pre-mRNA-splicing factor 38 n=1 Tax=Clohesyomyces aquaticus TaxID=1231657 RepID=A0A1Y1ZQ20_9PLEO|nr:PRP38 family-domain-containing protein [Clohesyomyces aquaticus]